VASNPLTKGISPINVIRNSDTGFARILVTPTPSTHPDLVVPPAASSALVNGELNRSRSRHPNCRRARKIDPEWAQRNRLLRAGETLNDDEATKMHDAMRAADPSGGLERCWQGKECSGSC